MIFADDLKPTRRRILVNDRGAVLDFVVEVGARTCLIRPLRSRRTGVHAVTVSWSQVYDRALMSRADPLAAIVRRAR